MNRIALLVVGILSISTSALAQATPDIDKALLPAPANMREGATIIKWKPDFTYDTVRKGTNRLVCYDRSGIILGRSNEERRGSTGFWMYKRSI